MYTHLPYPHKRSIQHRADRFSGVVGALPYTIATLPAQFAVLTLLLKPMAGRQLPAIDPTRQLALFTPEDSILASVLLLLMLLGVSAFLVHRLRRILHNMNNPTLKDVILVRTLEVKRYRKMLSKAEHMANAGSWFSETKSGILTWSDELFRIFGFEPTEIAPDKDIRLGLVHPDDRKMFVDNELKSISTGQAYKIRMRIMRPNGSYRIIAHYVEPEFDSNGNLVRRIGTVVDITHQVANESTFRMMFDQTPYPYMIINRQGILECNQEALDMYGRTAEEISGHHLSDFAPQYQPDGELSDEKANKMISLAYKNGIHKSDWLLTNSDGHDSLAEINLSRFRSGGESNLMVVMHDRS